MLKGCEGFFVYHDWEERKRESGWEKRDEKKKKELSSLNKSSRVIEREREDSDTPIFINFHFFYTLIK